MCALKIESLRAAAIEENGKGPSNVRKNRLRNIFALHILKALSEKRELRDNIAITGSCALRLALDSPRYADSVDFVITPDGSKGQIDKLANLLASIAWKVDGYPVKFGADEKHTTGSVSRFDFSTNITELVGLEKLGVGVKAIRNDNPLETIRHEMPDGYLTILSPKQVILEKIVQNLADILSNKGVMIRRRGSIIKGRETDVFDYYFALQHVIQVTIAELILRIGYRENVESGIAEMIGSIYNQEEAIKIIVAERLDEGFAREFNFKQMINGAARFLGFSFLGKNREELL